MSPVNGETLFLLFFGIGSSLLLLMPCVVVMHFLMPPAVLDRYWKSPYFRPTEVALFAGSILALMRTIMLMGAIAFPSLGKKRKITEAHRLVPRWYRVAAIAISVWAVSGTLFVLVVTIGGYIYAFASGDPISARRQ